MVADRAWTQWRLTALALLAAGLAGCGSGGEKTPSAATGPTTTSDASRTAKPTQPVQGQGAREADPDERLRIERTVRRYVAELNAHDGDGLCSALAPGALHGVRLPVNRGSCAASLDGSIGYPAPGGAPSWVATRLVDADTVVLLAGGYGRFTGTFVHTFAGGREPSIEDDVVYLRRIGGEWRIVKPSATFYRAIGRRDIPIGSLTPP